MRLLKCGIIILAITILVTLINYTNEQTKDAYKRCEQSHSHGYCVKKLEGVY